MSHFLLKEKAAPSRCIGTSRFWCGSCLRLNLSDAKIGVLVQNSVEHFRLNSLQDGGDERCWVHYAVWVNLTILKLLRVSVKVSGTTLHERIESSKQDSRIAPPEPNGTFGRVCSFLAPVPMQIGRQAKERRVWSGPKDSVGATNSNTGV